MDKHEDTNGLQRFLQRQYFAPKHIPADRMTPSDALRRLGSALYGSAWLGDEVQLVEPNTDSDNLISAAWQRRSKTVQIMAELLETEIAHAVAYDPQDGSESELDPSIWRTPIGQIALDSGEVQNLCGQRRMQPVALLIEHESFETALASLPLPRAVADQDANTGTHREYQKSLPPQPTYMEVLEHIELLYVVEGVNYLKDRLIDALMIKKLIAFGQRRSRPANSSDRRLITAKDIAPVEPLVWAQNVPQGIGQFIQDPAKDPDEGWLNVSFVRANFMGWLKAEIDEANHLKRFERAADSTTKKQDALDAELRCRKWLEGEMRKDGHLMKKAWAKSEYRRQAVKQFGVPLRQFNRAWDNAIEKTGAKHWREAGRPAKGG